MTETQVTWEDKAQLLNKINDSIQKLDRATTKILIAEEKYQEMFQAIIKFENITNARLKEQKDLIRYLKRRLSKYEYDADKRERT